MYKTLRTPLVLQVEVTDACFQKCGHCYRSCQLKKALPIKKMTIPQIEHVVEEASRCKVFQLVFTGGDPLMYPEVFMAGVLKAKKLGIFRNVNTNLGLLTPELAQFIVENKVAVLSTLFSFDRYLHDQIAGYEGSFDSVTTNIRLLASMGCKVSVNMVVRKDNALQVLQTGRFAVELGAIKFAATKAAPTPGIDYETYRPSAQQLRAALDALLTLQAETGVAVDTLESYPFCFYQDLEKYQMFARRNCTAGVFNCTVGPDGYLRPCSHADLHYGNVFETPLEVCWQSMQEWRDGSLLNAKCAGCKFLRGCSGGCRFDAKYTCGDICGEDPLMGDVATIKMPNEPAPPSLEFPVSLNVSRLLRHRPEDFGGVLWVEKNVLMMTTEGYAVVCRLLDILGSADFCPDTLELEGVPRGNLMKILAVLRSHGILEERR